MRYSRVTIAKFALGIASEDEIFWVNKCRQQSAECAKAIAELEELAELSATIECMDPHDLIEAGDTHKVSTLDQDHLIRCSRCARIGQYISMMPFPGNQKERTSLSA